MENIKFYVSTFLLVVAAGFLGYGAVNSLRDPVYYLNDQTLVAKGNIKDDFQQENSTDTVLNNNTSEEYNTTTNTDTSSLENPAELPTETPSIEPVDSLATSVGIKSILEKIPSGTIIKKGDSGEQVKAIQVALNMVAKAGLPTSGTGYGTFGNQTEAAVKKFQTDNKITPTSGQVASKTLSALIAKLK